MAVSSHDLTAAARHSVDDCLQDVPSDRVLVVDSAAAVTHDVTADGYDAVRIGRSDPRTLARSDRVLFDRGLLRLATPDAAGAIYLRSSLIRDPHAAGDRTRGVVTMAHLGHNAGFANQLFQYAFLKLYGLRSNCAIETPPWSGESVYGIPARRITRSLPEYRGDEWSVRDLALWKMDAPPVNVDFWGYYQNVPPSWPQHRTFLRRLFQPLPPWSVPVETWLRRHRPPGATLVALHLRRGDYRGFDPAEKPWFRVLPEEFYRRWLAKVWPTFPNPILFIASDDLDSVLPAFRDYAPLTAAALEQELPEPRHLADFQILAAADVLAICNSSFSRMAALLAPPGQRCFIPSLAAETFEPYDPWAADHFWRRFGAPDVDRRWFLRLPRWLRRHAAI